MAKNVMSEVAKLLGVELEEEFRIKYDNKAMYTLMEDGFFEVISRNTYLQRDIDNLLNGEWEVVKIPKPILDKKEKEYLSNVIKPFRDKVISIANYYEESIDKNFIEIEVKQSYCNENQYVSLPYFRKGAMYKGMVEYKKYTLAELGL